MKIGSASVLVCLVLGLTGLGAGAVKPAAPDDFYAAIRSGDHARLQALVAGGADVNGKERRGGATPLMHAAAIGSVEAMQLLIDKGADVNARSTIGATALMWAATDLAKVRLLVERGADVRAVSDSGRTALLLAAMSDRSAAVVRLLLSRGADPRAADKDRMTPVFAAAFGNDVETLRQLVAAGADVSSPTVIGDTPLMQAAANGNADAVKLLISKGADVNAVSGPPTGKVKNGIVGLGRFTALILASAYGPVSVVKALVDAGADVNAVEARGMTPLMYAVATDHGDLGIVKLLTARGARLDIRTPDGETAFDWARKSGTTPAVALLQRAGPPAASARPASLPAAVPTTARAAANRGVTLLERTSAAYFPAGGCGACHAQNITDITVMHARRAGLTVDGAAVAQRSGGASAMFGSTAPRLFERFDGPAIDILLYALHSLRSADHPADRATDAMVFNIAAQQQRDGRWHIGGVPRPPIGDGDVTRTALGVRAIAAYGLPGRAAEMSERVKHATAWLQSTRPRSVEDHGFRLFGLMWGGADAGLLERGARDLAALQRTDGGWAQTTAMESDPYATGLALLALLEAGRFPATSDVVRRGTEYLLSIQRPDGSWYVRSRSPKFQPYFDGGFPYEHDQWISAMATGWATSALARGLSEGTSAAASR